MACDITVAETIETLTERLQTSTLLEDRRDACRGLRSLAKDYRVEVCAQAMDALLNEIREDKKENDDQDLETLLYCLESLNYIISGSLGDSPAATWPDSPQDQQHNQDNHHQQANIAHSSSSYSTTSYNLQQSSHLQQQNNASSSSNTKFASDPGKELAEIFLKKKDNVTKVINSSEHNDYKIRWVAVRLLCGLARQKLEVVQDSILSFPLGISRLTQLINDEEHELIRNDALVLFVRLTQSNQNIQNLVAFENCFDKIMFIIQAENYLSGTVAVVMDCLNILLNLTQYNESNQILFREGSNIQKLLPFFENIKPINMTIEQVNCLVLVLRIIDTMIQQNNSPIHVQACQDIMLRSGLLNKLCELLTAPYMPIGVLSETMNTASDIIRGHLGSNLGMVMPTNAMMPILLLSMVKEMCNDQERRISELYTYVQSLHGYITNACNSNKS